MQNVLLHFHWNNDYANKSQCYVIRILCVLLLRTDTLNCLNVRSIYPKVQPFLNLNKT